MKPYYEDGSITLHHGDALKCARLLPSESVQTIITSPPYFGLRDYGEQGQMGAEGTFVEYVAAMRQLFGELRRVLTDDGTLWLNLGDSYSSSPPGNVRGVSEKSNLSGASSDKYRATLVAGHGTKRDTSKQGIPAKNLLGIPWRVAFALQEDGWVLRSDIIWAKLSAMPESVTDRPTKSHEYLFLFAKSARYFYDAAAIAEPVIKGSSGSRFDEGKTSTHQAGRASTKPREDRQMKNKRTVWPVAPVPFSGAHFAVYPPELIRPCVLAGSRVGDTVLDPFSGSGTTGMVATQEGRKYVGFDLNSDYLDLSLRTRFAQPVLNLGGVA